MQCTTKGALAAYQCRQRANRHQESIPDHSPASPDEQAIPDEHCRVVAILAMGGNDVPPTLVRRAIDERWSMKRAAEEFGRTVCAQVG